MPLELAVMNEIMFIVLLGSDKTYFSYSQSRSSGTCLMKLREQCYKTFFNVIASIKTTNCVSHQFRIKVLAKGPSKSDSKVIIV
jgi:hypothetical protein